MLYIGVDLGTSAVKLLMMDENGNIQKIVSKEYPLYFPHPGWSEQNPQDWFAQSMEGIKELTSECDKSQVAGISFGGQMHGLVVLDKDDQVIRPAILWNDGRTAKETDYLNQVTDQVKLEVETARVSLSQTMEQVRLTEGSLSKAFENERMALERYTEGKASVIEVIEAQTYRQASQLNHVQAKVSAQGAYSELIRALNKY